MDGECLLIVTAEVDPAKEGTFSGTGSGTGSFKAGLAEVSWGKGGGDAVGGQMFVNGPVRHG
jgi:hypothetical protein